MQECNFFEVGSFVLVFSSSFHIKDFIWPVPLRLFFHFLKFFSDARSILKLQRSEQQEIKLVWPQKFSQTTDSIDIVVMTTCTCS